MSNRTMPMNTQSVGKIQCNYIPASSRTMAIQWQSKVWLMSVNLDFVLVITWPWDNIQPRHKYGVVEVSINKNSGCMKNT